MMNECNCRLQKGNNTKMVDNHTPIYHIYMLTPCKYYNILLAPCPKIRFIWQPYWVDQTDSSLNIEVCLFNCPWLVLPLTFYKNDTLCNKGKVKARWAKGPNGWSLYRFLLHEACPGVSLLPPGRDTSPSQGYPPPPPPTIYTHLYTLVKRDKVG